MKTITKFDVILVKETAKRYELESKAIRSPEDAARIFRMVFNLEQQTREKFCMLALNTKNEVIGAFEVFQGSVNASVVATRDIFQRLLLVNASQFICAHNHPSGNPEPSKEDIHVTSSLMGAGALLGIQCLDHLVIGDTNRFISIKEHASL